MLRGTSLGVAALSLLALSWGASCGGDDSGAGGSGTGSPSGGAGGVGGGGGSGGLGGDTSQGGNGVCEDSSTEPCGACTYTNCQQEFCNCGANADCPQLAECQLGCADDAACIQDCWTSYSDGIADGALLLQCGALNCSNECPGLQPLGDCEVCLLETCPSAMNTCLGNPECAALLGCVVECGGDNNCSTQCYFDHGGGINDAGPVGECASNSCATSCNL